MQVGSWASSFIFGITGEGAVGLVESHTDDLGDATDF